MEPRGLSSIPLPYEAEDDKHSQRAPVHHQGPQFLPGFLRNLKQDDIILIFLIILLEVKKPGRNWRGATMITSWWQYS